ncbi:GNAT family N-acetyltransferase [Streptomyces sp. NPDC093252]|uniref:GNAT family N-acetyltransferase n=1 Tax=Streptomyces sp. NPDC093252 TaxID=3154980 RepID=UPI00344A5AE2
MDPVIRPATPADAPGISALLNAVDLIEIGREETDTAQVQEDLTHPEAALAENSWLAFHDGRLVAYGLVWDDSRGERIDMDHYVLPEHQDAGERLLDLMEAQTVRRARANGAEKAVVHLHLNIRPTLDTALLTRRGWSTVRRYHVLTRPLDPAADPLPPAPAGLRLRDCRDEADRRTAHALVEETFVDHFDHTPLTYDQWLTNLGNRMEWDRVWIASLEGEGDAAVLVTSDHREPYGWINILGVRKAFRGRGIAGHLLRHAFGSYAATGRDTIGLGVDTANETGALRLYERHGMRTHFAVDTWEVTLPVTPDHPGA